MASEEFNAKTSSKSKRATKQANSGKVSTLALMPWEKRHQHTMVKFLERTPSPKSFVQVDQIFANSPLEQNSCSNTKKRIRVCSGILAKENIEQDFKQNSHGLLTQNESLGTSKAGGQRKFAASFKEGPLQSFNCEIAASEGNAQAETRCVSSVMQDLLTYKTFQGQMHKFNVSKLIENNKKKSSTGCTKSSGYAVKYNLDKLFRYECSKDKKPLRKKLEICISHSQKMGSNGSGKVKKLAFSRHIRHLAKYSMDNVFEYDKI